MLSVRDDFPILNVSVGGKPLVYFDSAATMQKPLPVIQATENFYRFENSNVHRGLHALSELATKHFEEAREAVRKHINATSVSEIIFVRGTTEAINLVASSFAEPRLKAGDEIIISSLEHHANIIPWQVVCQKTGAKLNVIKMNDKGDLNIEHFKSLLSDKTKILALSHVSNAIGTINPVKEMIAVAKQYDVTVLLDGAQAAPHLGIDVLDLDCDFYAFSSHKAYGPTGFGVLYGREALLESMPPYQTGGEMIKRVTFEDAVYNELPHKFEAGTPDIAGAIGFKAALEYLNAIGWDNIMEHEQALLTYATSKMNDIPGLKIYGSAEHKASLVSFVLEGVHAHDVGTVLDSEGVACRAGHHCAMPLMGLLGVPATTRASFSIYNTTDEIDVLVEALNKIRRLFHS